MVNNFIPERKRFPFPLIVLRNFVLTPNRTHPTMTYSYEQLSPTGHAQFLKKAAAYRTNGHVRKRKDKNNRYASIKHKEWIVILSQEQY